MISFQILWEHQIMSKNMAINILFTCAGRRNYLINYFKDALDGNGQIIAADMNLTAPAMVDADLAIVHEVDEAGELRVFDVRGHHKHRVRRVGVTLENCAEISRAGGEYYSVSADLVLFVDRKGDVEELLLGAQLLQGGGDVGLELVPVKHV